MALFYSPVAYVVLFLFMFSNGWMFYSYCITYARAPQQITLVLNSLFGFAFFWVLPLSPLLAMRLFSEEKRTGTLEMLLTAPVRASEVVLGKFLSAFVVLAILVLMSLYLPALIFVNGKVRGDRIKI